MINKDTRHPDRSDLVRAIETGINPHADHLRECRFCQTMYRLLTISLTGRGEQENAPDAVNETVYRAAALAAYDQSRHPAQSVTGRIDHDSWADSPATAVRDCLSGQERRLSLTAQGYRLDVIAERQQDHWDCVARLYKDNQPIGHFILTAGKRKLHTEARRCYFWSAKTPPRRLSVASADVSIDFGTISW